MKENKELAKRLNRIAYIASAVILIIVGGMRSIKINTDIDFSFLFGQVDGAERFLIQLARIGIVGCTCRQSNAVVERRSTAVLSGSGDAGLVLQVFRA